ncbi:MAG: PSD1 and planctomycete cytochrome C domain-containing protein [Acidobacteriota bacterium]
MKLILVLAGAGLLWGAGYSDVEPIFRAKCYGCHGPGKQTSGFRLDDAEAALAGGYGGKAIVPGKSAESELWRRVAARSSHMAMPMGSQGLPAAEVARIAAWIDAGAEFPASLKASAKRSQPKHWAYQPVSKPAGGSIDEFIRARLAKENLRMSPEADRPTLLRRVALDLTGLPPTPEEVRAFVADRSPEAYAKQVDRLLASPHFGEKWARHWLDQARYADSDGYEKDWARPWAWRWREWVIGAINRDMPFDQFTREQIAGDLLPGATVEQRVATGFHRNTLTNREGGIDNQQFRFENIADRAATVGSVWLGLTVGCAQCHDHKYDPIQQKDFYSLYAFFDNAEEEDIEAPLPGEKNVRGPEYTARREALIAEYKVREMQPDWEKNMLQAAAEPGKRTDWDLAWDCLLKLTEGGDGARIMRKPFAKRTQREKLVLETHFVRNYHFAIGQPAYRKLKFDELDKKLRALDEEFPPLSEAYTIAEEPEPKQSYLRVRGDYKTLGIPVEPDAPGFLPPLGKSGGRATRRELADWLTAPENPLVSRVAVNRVWQELFGAGLVKTSEDFGVMGARPSHPELLDWLAAEFRERGWSRKAIIRTMVLSAAYRQSSHARPELQELDPENRLLARQSRLRLPAEAIRDAALRVSGLLDPRIGGPSVKPPQPEGVTALGYSSGTKWQVSGGTDRYRRGVYIHYQRTTPYPLLANFDAPRSTVAACRRTRSNTPLQALNLLNDPVFLEAAEQLGKRAKTVEEAFELALQRKPTAAERARLERFQAENNTTLMASVLLNLDEFITRE